MINQKTWKKVMVSIENMSNEEYTDMVDEIFDEYYANEIKETITEKLDVHIIINKVTGKRLGEAIYEA